jgi:Na+-transporting NADH:ubiquinone oxidoreductase subunit NqrB
MAVPQLWRDPRHYQILCLSLLLAAGVAWLGFDVPYACMAAIAASALATQYAFTRILRLPAFDPRSPLITALSLCILLRANSPVVPALAACVAIASKFVLRIEGRHIFNPANIAIALCVFLHLAWISPAQWGSTAWFAFLFACLGGLVTSRARRADVGLAFLACYIGLLFARAFWLGDPLAIPLKQMRSGALLLFAFFMISDPKTTPESRAGRLLFAGLVAAFAFTLQYGLYIPQGLMYALALLAPLSLLLNRLLPGQSYAWENTARGEAA